MKFHIFQKIFENAFSNEIKILNGLWYNLKILKILYAYPMKFHIFSENF